MEDLEGQRKPGEEVKNGNQLEPIQTKKAADLGEVGEPDVVDVFRPQNAGFRRKILRRSRSELSAPVSADRFAADLGAGSGQDLRDLEVAPDAETIEPQNEASDDVIVSAQGRIGSDERADDLGDGSHLLQLDLSQHALSETRLHRAVVPPPLRQGVGESE